jgi:hypothetical protein
MLVLMFEVDKWEMKIFNSATVQGEGSAGGQSKVEQSKVEQSKVEQGRVRVEQE